MKRNPSLFHHTALTIAVGLLLFQLISAAAVFNNLIFPLAQRSADDLSALLIWSGQVWQTSSPPERISFEKELRDKHGIGIKVVTQPQTETITPYPYPNFLRNALKKRLPEQSQVRVTEDAHEQFQVELYRQEEWLHFEFAKALLTPQPALALFWTLTAGIAATLIVAWVLAKRITAPIARLTIAAKRIGQGQLPQQLPESGEAELAELARIFNETARQLQARRENQNTLLAGVSHDLRSPLARMKMALGVLAEQQPSKLIERMEHDIAEMDTLIGAQLELARAQEPEKAEQIQLKQFLEDVVDAGSSQAPGRLHLKHCPNLIVSLAPTSLRRCLDNLIVNALRYSNGPVDIVCRYYHGTFYIGIRDRGPGIPRHLRETVFRPFYRLESSRNRATGGSGLGLAITRQLAETQGWQVRIKSRYGGGSAAWLFISQI